MSATHNSFGRSAKKLRRTRSLAGWGSVACRVVIGALLRRLMPAIPAARISRAIRFRPAERPLAFSLGHEHAVRHRFHAIQRGSCGYDASDRRRRSPEPKQVGSARRTICQTVECDRLPPQDAFPVPESAPSLGGVARAGASDP